MFVGCILPQIKTIASNIMNVFSSAFNVGNVISIMYESPTVFKNIVIGIQTFNSASKQKTVALKYNGYGRATSIIVMAVVQVFLGLPKRPCPKVK